MTAQVRVSCRACGAQPLIPISVVSLSNHDSIMFDCPACEEPQMTDGINDATMQVLHDSMAAHLETILLG